MKHLAERGKEDAREHTKGSLLSNSLLSLRTIVLKYRYENQLHKYKYDIPFLIKHNTHMNTICSGDFSPTTCKTTYLYQRDLKVEFMVQGESFQPYLKQ